MHSPSTSPEPQLVQDTSGRSIRSVACKECRRSKIRCSRTIPCDACTRRGCPEICPDRTKESRRSRTDEMLLHENSRLNRRVKYLEKILTSLFQATDIHPVPEMPQSRSIYESLDSPTASPLIFESDEQNTIQSPNSDESTDSYPTLDSIQKLGWEFERNKTILAPGLRFMLQAISEITRNSENSNIQTPSSIFQVQAALGEHRDSNTSSPDSSDSMEMVASTVAPAIPDTIHLDYLPGPGTSAEGSPTQGPVPGTDDHFQNTSFHLNHSGYQFDYYGDSLVYLASMPTPSATST